jgi:hypothetical protein
MAANALNEAGFRLPKGDWPHGPTTHNWNNGCRDHPIKPVRPDGQTAFQLIRRLITEYGLTHWPRYAVAFVLMGIGAGVHRLVRLPHGHRGQRSLRQSQLFPGS